MNAIIVIIEQTESKDRIHPGRGREAGDEKTHHRLSLLVPSLTLLLSAFLGPPR